MPQRARVLTQKEISNIFKLLKTKRDKVMFGIGIYAGLRMGEIVSLKLNQLFTKSDGVRNVLRLVRSKKKNTVYSEIPIHPKLRERLVSYKKELDFESKWLFPSNDSASGHIERARAHNIFRSAFDDLGLDDASTHSMRRTCLTNMSRSGVPLRTIQEISGHANLNQLQSYLAVDPADKRRAINLLRY